MKYVPTIGLEIHAELKTKTKMFCDSLNDPDEKHPNINVCPVCMGHPGTLPVANQEAIRKIISVGLALGCSINRETFFERKNYFYPDLPKGYQISQFQKPFCAEGSLEVNGKNIRLERIHLEEDAGRLYHLPGKDYTLADYNRAGMPLMELVTKPDLKTAEDVFKFAQELRLILRYLGASDADMEKGQMRVEVNISLAPEGQPWGTKVEVKNINSISAAAKTVEYEIIRQTELLEKGEKIAQETRGWDDVNEKTVSQRSKEGSADYRYFPEPDLPPVVLSEDFLTELKATLSELPSQRRRRFAQEYKLSEKDIESMTNNRILGNYFEKVVSELLADDKDEHLKDQSAEHKQRLIKLAANYLITELARMAAEVDAQPQDTKITPEMFADLVRRIGDAQISSSAAQTVLKEMFQTGQRPDAIIHAKDLAQVSDTDELAGIVREVVGENQKPADEFRAGKEATLKFLVGKVMAKSKGKANPQVAEQLLREVLK